MTEEEVKMKKLIEIDSDDIIYKGYRITIIHDEWYVTKYSTEKKEHVEITKKHFLESVFECIDKLENG